MEAQGSKLKAESKKLVSTEEAAKIWGTTPRTIRRWIEIEKIEGQFVDSGKGYGKAGRVLMVYVDNEAQSSKLKAQMKNENHPDRYRVHRGDPSSNVVTPMKNGLPVMSNQLSVISKEPESSEKHNLKGGDPVGDDAARQLPVGIISESPPLSNLPAIYNDTKRVPARCNRIANLRYALIQAFQVEISKNSRPKTEIVKSFLDLFNTGFILPNIHEEFGSISKSTLYDWQRVYQQGGIDSLVPQYGGNGISKITAAEKQFLRQKLLNQNKPTIGDSINKCKFLLGDQSPSSPATLRRWINQFKKENYDLWVLEREGEKALNDKCVQYAEREWRDLAVGDAVVADGHKLNFQIISPFTGKSTRAAMVLFWDWKSAYPLGWEIMLTENIQCVMAALRNAIITLGKFPTHALLDNGKAFRANVFTKKFRFQETEIPGIFDRLSIKPHFALPYNAQSKPIERFFRTFNDWFERELSSYSGASIPDKPAYMNRNEKRAKKLHDEWVPTIKETMEMIFQWREYYIDQELRARDYQKPRDIFEAEKGPGVDPFVLHFLMMTCKARMVHRNGITFNGWHWYHENLYGLKDYVLMYYSYYDLSQVYIFYKNEFLCVAKPVEKVKPFAADSEFSEDMAAVNRIQSLKRSAIRQSKKLTDTLRSNQNLQIDWTRTLRNSPEIVGAIKQIENKNKKVVNLSPYAGAPEPEIPAEDEKQPLHFSSASARYEFHLNGGTYRGPELDQKFIDDYRSGKIAPGEWDAIYKEAEEGINERKVCNN